jgi:archaellum biogenesis ATPase FlaH
MGRSWPKSPGQTEGSELSLDNLMGNLERELAPLAGKKVLLTSNYIYLNKVSLCILKLLLSVRKLKGIYIAVDRPYTYTSRLLEKHGIPQDNLFFLDAVSNISSEKIVTAKNAELINSPFCSYILEDALAKLTNNGGRLENVDFIFLDNLTVMLTYMDDKCLYGFLGQFVIKLASENRTLTLTMVDKDAHPKIYAMAKQHSDIEVEIKGDWLRR